jgi:hypothetical protein
MKNQKIVLSLLLAALLLAGCTKTSIEQTPEPIVTPSEIPIEEPSDTTPIGPAADISLMYFTFPQAVEASDCAVIAEFVSYTPKQRYVEYVFNVSEVLRGYVPENPIIVRELGADAHILYSGMSPEMGTDRFTVGNEYVLILYRTDMIFYDRTQFSFTAFGLHIPVNDIGRGRMCGELISEHFDGDVIAYIREAEPPPEVIPSYTASEDMAEIIEFSDIVAEVKIVSLGMERADNGINYSAEILNELKGSSLNKGDDGRVNIALIKGSAEIDGKYIVMLNGRDETSFRYTQSSLRSVISMEDTEAVAEVMRILEG